MPPFRSASSSISSDTTAYTSFALSLSLTLSVSFELKDIKSELSPVSTPSTWKRLATYSPESSITMMA